jgi:hypothetical protein
MVRHSYRPLRAHARERRPVAASSAAPGLGGPGTVSDNLVGMVMETMQPEHVPLWLKPQTAQNGKQAD